MFTNAISLRWHIGSCSEDYYPHKRGFDSFRGILHSGSDHYTYEQSFGGELGYDLHYNGDIDYEGNGTYSSVSQRFRGEHHRK